MAALDQQRPIQKRWLISGLLSHFQMSINIEAAMSLAMTRIKLQPKKLIAPLFLFWTCLRMSTESSRQLKWFREGSRMSALGVGLGTRQRYRVDKSCINTNLLRYLELKNNPSHSPTLFNTIKTTLNRFLRFHSS